MVEFHYKIPNNRWATFETRVSSITNQKAIRSQKSTNETHFGSLSEVENRDPRNLMAKFH